MKMAQCLAGLLGVAVLGFAVNAYSATPLETAKANAVTAEQKADATLKAAQDLVAKDQAALKVAQDNLAKAGTDPAAIKKAQAAVDAAAKELKKHEADLKIIADLVARIKAAAKESIEAANKVAGAKPEDALWLTQTAINASHKATRLSKQLDKRMAEMITGPTTTTTTTTSSTTTTTTSTTTTSTTIPPRRPSTPTPVGNT
jgi:septation ring formation regulator EzrA